MCVIMSIDMDNLTQLTTDHRRVMQLIAEYEWLESQSFHGKLRADQLDAIREIETILIADAEALTAQIHDITTLLDNHDCHISEEDGCDCVKEGYARD